jgi:hypothetical protein
MACRDRPEARGDGIIERYFSLVSGFGLDVSLLEDRVPLLLAAACLLRLREAGSPDELVRSTLAASSAIETHPGWLEIHGRSLRLVLAAILVANQLDPVRFVTERSGLFKSFESLEVDRSPVHRSLAMLALRLTGGDTPIQHGQINRVQSVYLQISGRHPMIADARLLAVCGLLIARGDASELLGRRVNAVYRLLRRRAGLSWGLPLLSASTVLATSAFEPEAIATRVRELAQALRYAGLTTGESTYEEIAVLTLLALPVGRIAERVRRYQSRIEAHFGWREFVPIAFVLAVDLLLADCVTTDPRLGALVDLKLALDVIA